MQLLLLFTISLSWNYGTSFDHTITAPKAFRIGVEEKVILNLHDGYAQATVSAYFQNLAEDELAGSIPEFAVENVNQPVELRMMISLADYDRLEKPRRVYFNIEVTNSNGGDFTKKSEVLISTESGYLFIITDRPIYKPGDDVQIKVFPLDQTMRQNINSLVTITIKTPDGIGVSRSIKRFQRGDDFLEDVHIVDELAILGNWVAEAKYSVDGVTTTTETIFVVRRYVLPAFQVRIELEKYFLLTTDEHISGTIKAYYSYGKPVSGNYFLSMKLKKTPDSFPIEFFKRPGTFLLTATITNGERSFEIDINELTDSLEDDESLADLAASGASIYIEVTVNGEAQGVLESAVTPDLPIVTSPYLIDIRRTSSYFTPSLAYKLQANLLYAHGGQPAANVRIFITVHGNNVPFETQSDDHGLIDYQLDFDNAMNKNIQIRTVDPLLDNEGQAQAALVVRPYRSTANRYLQVSADDNFLRVRANFQFTFSYNAPTPAEIRYFVLSRGSIVHSGVNNPRGNNAESTETFRITQAMVPSIRIIGYYLVGNEIVSNSLWLDVEDQCKRDLTISTSEEVLPGSRAVIRVRGARNALVSVSGVDKAAYFLYNGSRLTRQKMFDRMESYDQGCVRNGGEDGVGVFWEAGVTISTSRIKRRTVESLNCAEAEGKRRKKRQAPEETTTDAGFSLEQCDRDGRLNKLFDNDTCANRAERVKLNIDVTVSGCSQAFYNACKEAEVQRKNFFWGGRSSGDRAAAERSMARLRTSFRENLVFANVRLNERGEGILGQSARDSITTYEIDAVSMQDEADGFCVAKPVELRVFKNVFAKVYAPYSLKKLEQANLKIVVFNYDEVRDHELDVQIKTDEEDHLCTHFPTDAWTTLIGFTVASQSAESTILTVLPLRIPEDGTASVYVKITTAGNRILDQLRKDIIIEESGEIKNISKSYPVDLKNDRRRTFGIRFDFRDPFVPGTRPQCWLYAYANFMGPSIVIDPVHLQAQNVESLLRMPGGCGEQNMHKCGPTIFAMSYLIHIGRMQPNTPAYAAAVQKIQNGYAIQLGHRSSSGRHPFSVYSHAQPSTWLNAYVNKVFMKGKEFDTNLNVGPICSSMEWLLEQQANDGHFREPGSTGLRGAAAGDFMVTAYVVISMLETESKCSDSLRQRIEAAVTNARVYLETNLPAQMRPFQMAIALYALALHNPRNRDTKRQFQRLLSLPSAVRDAGKLHFNQGSPTANVEATSYALLAQLALVKFENPPEQASVDRARTMMLWLLTQRNEAGAFSSTQDSVMGLQALVAYHTVIATLDEGEADIDMTIRFTTAEGSEWHENGESLTLDNNNIRYRENIEVPANVTRLGLVLVSATGRGEGVVSYRCVYRTLIEEDDCQFEINHNIAIMNLEEVNARREHTRIRFTLVISRPEGDAANMTIVEIGLLSGFVPIEQSLLRLAIPDAVDGIIDRYEISNVNVILYLREVTEDNLVLAFEMEQRIEVERPEPAKINVYDYYEPSVHCGFFYSLPDNTPHIRKSGCNGENRDEDNFCRCAEGGCMSCRSRDKQLNAAACLSEGEVDENCVTCAGDSCENLFQTACRSNYVYTVNITSIAAPQRGNIFYDVEGIVQDVMKSGDAGDNAKDRKETFLIRRDCFQSCRDTALPGSRDRSGNQVHAFFTIGSLVTMMGNAPEIFRDRNNQVRTTYRLDESAVVERNIPEARCNSARDRFDRSRLRCSDRNHRRRSRQQEKCDRWEKTIKACDNFVRLAEKLDEGCD